MPNETDTPSPNNTPATAPTPPPSNPPASKPPMLNIERGIDRAAVHRQAIVSLEKKKSKSDLEIEHLLRVDIQTRATALMGESTSPLIETLSLTVAICEHELRTRQHFNNPLSDFANGQKNYDRAMRRYLAACKTLATVQKLGLPFVQVNIAKNQVVKND